MKNHLEKVSSLEIFFFDHFYLKDTVAPKALLGPFGMRSLLVFSMGTLVLLKNLLLISKRWLGRVGFVKNSSFTRNNNYVSATFFRYSRDPNNHAFLKNTAAKMTGWI